MNPVMPEDYLEVPATHGPFVPEEFRARIRALAAPYWRDLVWRRTHDPYLIWTSEFMLQQTQVSRVEAMWDGWLARFPTVFHLAAAPEADVLAAWQGMGYNRRALNAHRAAQAVVERYDGIFPQERDALRRLPGIGPSTAAGIRAFAFDEADAYLETNVRTVFIHELFAEGPYADTSEIDQPVITDRMLLPFVWAACPESGHDVRGWYYALLDYGAHLKKTLPNPSRRSSTYTRQSRFEGSFRQKRAEVVRILLAARSSGLNLTTEQVDALLTQEETAGGRPAPSYDVTLEVLKALQHEGLCVKTPDGWAIGSRED